MVAVGRAGIHAAVADLCGDGVDTDLCRGAGFIWVCDPLDVRFENMLT